jgi:hypothetical protein
MQGTSYNSSSNQTMSGVIARSGKFHPRTNSRIVRRRILGSFGGTCFSNPSQLVSDKFNTINTGFTEKAPKIHRESNKKHQQRVEKYSLNFGKPDVGQKEYFHT